MTPFLRYILARRLHWPVFKLVLFLLATGAQSQTLQIDPIKASYLEGFLSFARWKGEPKDQSATIGVLGSPDLVANLERAAEDTANGRKLRVVAITPNADMSSLDVLFVGAGYRENWNDLIETCCEAGVLLVGEEPGFLAAGGSIEFVVRRNRLRFLLSSENARKCGIQLSSKLLELALNDR